MSWHIAPGGQSVGVSASASVLPMNTQVCFLEDGLDWPLCCPRDPQESSSAPQYKGIDSSVLSLLHDPTLISVPDYWKNHSFDYTYVCWQSDVRHQTKGLSIKWCLLLSWRLAQDQEKRQTSKEEIRSECSEAESGGLTCRNEITMELHLVVAVQLPSHVWLLETPRTAACQASVSLTISWSLPKFRSMESVMPSNHLILCCLLLLLLLIFPSIRNCFFPGH